LKNKETPSIFGDGEQTRDFVFVSDVVEANMKAIAAEEGVGEYYNIATGNKITLNALLENLCNIYETDFKVNYKAISKLKWKPVIELNQGLRLLCESL